MKTPQWALVAIGALGGIILTLLIYLFAQTINPNHPVIQDSSKEVQVFVKDSLESQIFKRQRDSIQVAFDNYVLQSERKRKSHTNKFNQNEKFKQSVLSVTDSISVRTNDSLRARYSSLFIEKAD